jgi:hypothetical protein
MNSTHIYGLLKFNNKSKKYVGGGNYLAETSDTPYEKKVDTAIGIDRINTHEYIPNRSKPSSFYWVLSGVLLIITISLWFLFYL